MMFTDSPFLDSGMGRVHRNILSAYKSLPNIELASIGWHESKIREFDEIPVYPSPKLSYAPNKEEEIKYVEKALNAFNPDVFLTLGDIFDFSYMPQLVESQSIRWLGYFNIDSSPIHLDHLDRLAYPTHLATTSEYGKSVIESYDPTLDIDVVYHGINPKDFYDLNLSEEERVIHNDILGKRNIRESLAGKFVILMDSQNTHRKNYPKALEAFSKFSKDKDNVKLVIITQPENTKNGFSLGYAVQFLFGISPQKIVIYSNNLATKDVVPEDYVNHLYNISNIYLSASRAEGFGLSFLQAFATKTIPMAPHHASHIELLKDRGLTIDVGEYDFDVGYRRMALMDVEDCVKKLDYLYDDWENGGREARKFHRRGLEFAKQNTWEISAVKLLNSIGKCIQKTKRYYYPQPAIPFLNDMRFYVGNMVRTEKEKRIGMVVMGGMGDNIQAIPVIRGINKKYPNSRLVVICEAFQGIFFDPSGKKEYHPDMATLEAPRKSFASILKTIGSMFDAFYDIRYISKCYRKDEDYSSIPDETKEFFKKGNIFYNQWPWANNVIYKLNTHVVDMRLKSCGLQQYASVDDMQITPVPTKLPDGKYVTINNGAGNIGRLKILPHNELEKIVEYLIKKGYWVLQLGLPEEPLCKNAMDLRGMTNLWETAYLIQNAEIHLGPEGGLYHLCKAVGGRSLVWFSVTSPECFAYDDTIVIPHKRTEDFLCQPCWWKGMDYFHNNCMLGREYCENLPSHEDIIIALDEVGI